MTPSRPSLHTRGCSRGAVCLLPPPPLRPHARSAPGAARRPESQPLGALPHLFCFPGSPRHAPEPLTRRPRAPAAPPAPGNTPAAMARPAAACCLTAAPDRAVCAPARQAGRPPPGWAAMTSPCPGPQHHRPPWGPQHPPARPIPAPPPQVAGPGPNRRRCAPAAVAASPPRRPAPAARLLPGARGPRTRPAHGPRRLHPPHAAGADDGGFRRRPRALRPLGEPDGGPAAAAGGHPAPAGRRAEHRRRRRCLGGPVAARRGRCGPPPGWPARARRQLPGGLGCRRPAPLPPSLAIAAMQMPR